MFCYTTWWAWNDKRLPLFECAGCITVQQWNHPAHPHLSSHRGAGEAEGSKISEARWESSAQRGSPGGGAGRILHIWVAIIRDASPPDPPPQKKEKYYVDICKTTNRTFLPVFTSQHMTGMMANNCTSLQTLCTAWCFLRKHLTLMKCSLNVRHESECLMPPWLPSTKCLIACSRYMFMSGGGGMVVESKVGSQWQQFKTVFQHS